MCLFDGIAEHLVLDLFVLRNTQRIEHIYQLLRSKQTHQIIFQRDKELRLSRISLSTGTTAQLVVNTARFMTLCSDDLQTTGCLRLIIQLDIRTTTRHIGCNGNCPVTTCLCDDLGFFFMELGIQYIVRNALFAEESADLL